VRSVPRLHNDSCGWLRVAVVNSEKLVAEAGFIPRNQRCAVECRYQATVSDGVEDFMCAVAS
jgi:hypothetical protein